jgi:hypothetical protein
MITKLQEYAKFVAALLGVVVVSGVGLIPAGGIAWVQFILALVAAAAVYAVPNKVSTPPEV